MQEIGFSSTLLCKIDFSNTLFCKIGLSDTLFCKIVASDTQHTAPSHAEKQTPNRLRTQSHRP
jgi:hypothetical protein